MGINHAFYFSLHLSQRACQKEKIHTIACLSDI